MTIASKATFIACVLLSSVAFTSTAHAGNTFNKFPANHSSTNTHGHQETGFLITSKRSTITSTNNKRAKRVVKPLPAKPSYELSYTSDIGTLNQKRFNKMSPNTLKGTKTMPVYISESAYTAK